MRFLFCVIAATLPVTLLAAPGPGQGRAAEPIVTITVDASRPGGPLRPAWRFFGYDEPNYTYMTDGKTLLADLATLGPQTVFVRTHNLLTSGDGTPALKWGSTGVYTEDARRAAPLQLDDRRPHLRHLPRARRAALRADRLHARGTLAPIPSPTSTTGRRGGGSRSPPAGPTRPRTTRKWAELVFQWVNPLRRALRPGRGRAVVLGGLERAEHPLLAGDARGVPQAL